MFCHRCGKELNEGAKFCSACGAELMTQQPAVTDEEATQVAPKAEDTDYFDDTGFMLPNEQEYPTEFDSESLNVNSSNDLDKTQAFIRPPYEYSEEQEPYVDNGGYAPEQEYAPVYNNGYGVDYPNTPYAPDYSQGSYYPPENYAEPKRKLSAASIILICCSIILAVVIGAGTAVIHTQYGGFGEFIASFGDNEDREEKSEEEETDDEETTAPVTTQQATTLPPTTVTTTVPPATQPVRVGDGYCGTNLQYDFTSVTGELVIFGSGEMYDYSSSYAPWESYNVKRVIVEEGVTSISEGSLASQHLEYIYLSSTVSDFSIFALDYFAAIDVSPANPYYMSKDGVLFDKNGSVLICYPNENARTSYTVPNSVKWIGPYAFFNADNLTQLTLSPNVQYIDEYAFKSCNGLLYFTVPATVLEIETGAFYNWQSHQEIYFASGEVAVADDWNEGCEAEITIAE